MLLGRLKKPIVVVIFLIMPLTLNQYGAPEAAGSKEKWHLLTSSNRFSQPASAISYLTCHFKYRNWQANENKSLAFTRVELYRDGTYLNGTYTNINGDLTYGPIASPCNVVCWIYTRTEASRVTVLDYFTQLSYSEATPPIEIPTGQNVTFNHSFSDAGQGFTVFSFDSGLSRGWHYIYNETESDITEAVAEYPYDVGGRARYDPDTQHIYLPTNTYNYTDTILHEYGHYAMHFVFNWYWPPNSSIPIYNVTGCTNPYLAWTEGWAYYFPLAVKNSGSFNGWWDNYEFENNSWATPCWNDSDTVIGRVTGALFDLYDSQKDAPPWNYDSPITGGFNRTWQIMKDVPSNFASFWVRWNGTYYSHPKNDSDPYNQTDWTNTLLSIFQNSIDYRGQGDVEVDGVVDGSDNCIVAWRFGSWEGPPPSPRWDYLSDLNHDCVIDGADLAIVAQHFGESCDC
jgi:hypothetical protein